MFKSARNQKSFSRFITRRFRFAFDDTPEMLFEGLDDLGKPAAMERFDDQRPLGTQVCQRKIEREFAHLLNAGRVRAADARQVGSHVGHDQIDRTSIQRLLKLT